MSTADLSVPIFSHAFGKPPSKGVIRSCPEDFQVDEILGFEPDGQGEHFLLQIRKQNTNTDWLARQLANFADVKPPDVSFAGLKDRNAVTTQWFSVRIPGLSEPDWEQFSCEDYQIIHAQRHGRKLRRGSHKANSFRIVVRELQGDKPALEQRLKLMKQQGVPNYFGEQRFGRDGDNLTMAYRMLVEGERVKNRHKRSLYISAARSLLFNQVCSARVTNNSWRTGLDGDAMMLSGSHSFFIAESINAEIQKRLQQADITPTGPLWGRGPLATQGEAKAFEEQVLFDYSEWLKGLEHVGLKQERRALCIAVDDSHWKITDSNLELQFTLATGSYATSVLREVVNYYLPTNKQY